MDSLKKLRLEYDGLRKTITDYTSEGNIINFLDGLKFNIKEEDFESITYYLNEICKWYDYNIDKIHDNEYVIDIEAHDRNKNILETLRNDFNLNYTLEKGNEDNMYSKIFLSHTSTDAKYGNAIRNFLIALGIKDEQLIYTSSPLNKIPVGNNIFEYLKANIKKDILVIFLFSNDYLKSSACLNEMGAAWIVGNDYMNIYTPDFNFDNSQYQNCVVDKSKMGIILKNDEHCKMGILELKDKIIKNFGLSVNEKQCIYYIDKFMNEIVGG